MAERTEVKVERDWSRRVTRRSALVQIAVAAVLLGIGVFVIYQRGADRQVSTDHIENARAVLRLDSPLELRAVVDALKPAFASSTRQADAHAIAARAYVELTLVHRLPFREQAHTHLAEALSGDSQVEERHAAEALVKILDGKPDAALRLLERVKARRGDLEYARARALEAKGDLAGTRAAMEAAASLAPAEPRFHAALGDLLLAEGALDDADVAYQRALAANGAHPGAQLGRALVLARRGTDRPAAEAALAALRTGASLSPMQEARATEARFAPAIAADAVP